MSPSFSKIQNLLLIGINYFNKTSPTEKMNGKFTTILLDKKSHKEPNQTQRFAVSFVPKKSTEPLHIVTYK